MGLWSDVFFCLHVGGPITRGGGGGLSAAVYGIEKEKVGDRPAKLNEKKSDRELDRARDKKQGRHFLMEEQHENFVVAVRKWEIPEVTKLGENERQRKKSEKWTRT